MITYPLGGAELQEGRQELLARLVGRALARQNENHVLEKWAKDHSNSSLFFAKGGEFHENE